MAQVDLVAVYRLLFDHFGPRGWWPAQTPFEVCVGAILGQNVAWRNVEQAIASLKRADLLDCGKLASVDEEDLHQHLYPTRYYRQKARRLQAFCRHLLERWDGDIEAWMRGETQLVRRELLGLSGIGPETADSILLYAGSHPVFVVDAYTRRVFHRMGLWPPDVSYAEMQRVMMEALPREAQLYNEYHALIVALGAEYCRPRPRCGGCPLRSVCPEGASWLNGRGKTREGGG